MNGSDATVAAAFIASGTAIASAWYTRWQNRRDAKVANDRRNDPQLSKIEHDAYERARDSYEAALRTAADEARRSETRMRHCEEAADKAQKDADHANSRAEAAEAVARRHARQLAALNDYLRQNGVQIPDDIWRTK